ncbi:MAG: beta strand repeat-containing protein, partial [Solirubrobacteraceae bacterium]
YGGLDNNHSAIYKGKISLTNTIVAGNNQGTTTPTASDIGGNGASGVTGTYNLIGTGGSGGIANGSSGNVVLSSLATLGLAPLADYGGPTPTLALLPGSAAIGAGTSTGAPSTDQRGFALDSPIDIGAFQYASASPPVVTSATDGSATPSGSLNLRGALDLAGLQSGSVAISFSSSAFASATTIALSAGPLADTSTSATISIAGPSAGLTISGGNGGVIAVGSGANLSISDLTISGGSATLGGGVDNSGTLTLTACTITDGRATTGGGLYNKGTMTLVECTVAANSAAQGGAIANAGTLTLTASTISGNSAGTGGGGLYQSSAGSGATVNDTIVAGNLGTGGAADDIKGAGASNVTGSSSLIGTGGSGGIANGANGDIVLSSLATLGLSALGSYGGTTETFAILPGSAAIAAGNSTLLPSGVTTDQRGEPRTVNATMDIGAFESQGFTMTAISGSTPQAVLAGSAFTALGVTVTANNSIEPVAGGTVAFAVTAATDGASATLGSGSAIIGSGGTATVAATANSTGGVYSVSASTAGVSSGVTFDLTNQVQPAFSGLSAPTMTYGTASVQVSGTRAAGSQIPATQSVSIALDGVNQSATIGSDGSFSTTFTGLGTLSVSGSPYTISYSYTSDGTFLGASQSTSLTVNPATPTVSVSDSGGTYNGSAFDATDSVAGLSGVGASTLEGVGLTLTYYTGSTATGTPLSGAPSTAGTYTVVAAFAGSTDYTSGSAQTTFTITQATPTVTVTDAGGTYSGSPFAATDSIQGVSGPAGSTLEGVGLTITYYAGTTASGTPLAGAPSAAGTYTVTASFAGSTDYLSGSAQTTFTITQTTPTVSLSDAGGTYSGATFAATDSVQGVSGPAGSTLEGVGLTVTYYAGSTASGSPLSAAPSTAGTYTVTASFAGSTDYLSGSAQTTFTITQATPTVNLSDAGGTYSGATFAATDSIQGVSGPAGSTLEGVGLTVTYYAGSTASGSPLAGAPSAAGTYTVTASFAGSTDYLSGSASVTFTIAQATPTVNLTDAGGTYSGATFAATDSIQGVSGPAGSTLEGVGLTVTYYAGSTASGSPLSAAPSTAGTYTVTAAFPGSTDYTSSSAQTTFTIAQAAPTVSITDASGTYNGSAFAATDSVAGLSGVGASTLEGIGLSLSYYAGATATGTPLSSAPVSAGTYTVAASFPGSTDYAGGSAQSTFTIVQATPTVSVADAGGTYSGSPFAASATVAGLSGTGGASLEGVSPSLTYYTGTYASPSQLGGLTPLAGAPVHAGSYTVAATFSGSTDYLAETQLISFTITQAASTVAWSVPSAIVYGQPLGAGQLDAIASVPGSLTYSTGAGAVLGVGAWTLSAHFTPADSTDYTPASTSTTIQVEPVTPTLSVTDAGGTYTGSPYAATTTLLGVDGASGPALEGVAATLTYYAGPSAGGTPLPGAPSSVGTYTVVAAFAGSTDYAAARSAPVTFAIAAGDVNVALATSGGSTQYGQPVTLSAAVTSAAGPAAPVTSGTVTFLDGSNPLGTAAVDGSGRAELIVASLGPGGHAITAVYDGSAGFQQGRSGMVAQSVVQDGTQIVLTPRPTLHGKRVVKLGLSAQVQALPPGNFTPSGVLTFYFKKKILGRAVLSDGQATLPLKLNRVLNKAITVVYSGDGDFQATTTTSPRMTQRSLASIARAAHPTIRRTPARFAFGHLPAAAHPHRP